MRNDRPLTLSHANCFDFLRVAASLAVLYSHSFPLSGLQEPLYLAGQSLGSLAVAVFFAISGFLVCQSWSRDPSLSRFATRRALRIMPGLFVVVVATALLVGPIASTLTVPEYFSRATTWTYITSTLSFLAVPRLPGLFENNPFPNANNGSLWTLEYEVLMYLWLAAVGSLLPRSMLKVACVASLLSFAGCWFLLNQNNLTSYQLPFIWRFTEIYVDRVCNLGCYFFAGCCIYLFLARIPLSMVLAFCLLALYAILPNKTWVTALLWIAVPYGAISVAYRGPKVLRKISGFDYSYGIYVYAFPVQQMVAQYLPHVRDRWVVSFSISLLVTVLLAALSWHLVERPGLTLKGKLMPRERMRAFVAAPPEIAS